ncbi:MAG: RNA polymerase sigma factor [Terriglobales bacterium]
MHASSAGPPPPVTAGPACTSGFPIEPVLAALPRPQAELLRMRLLQGLSDRSIASALGTSAAAIRGRMRRATASAKKIAQAAKTGR